MDAQPLARRPLGAVGERLPRRIECYHLPPRRAQAARLGLIATVLTKMAARYRSGLFEFDAHSLELLKEGRLVRVRPQSLRLLALLVERAGEVLPREHIQATLWGSDTFVDFERGLNYCIAQKIGRAHV